MSAIEALRPLESVRCLTRLRWRTSERNSAQATKVDYADTWKREKLRCRIRRDHRRWFVIVEGAAIREMGAGRWRGVAGPDVIDGGRRFLMPGLLDFHFHTYSASFDMQALDRIPKPLLAAHATKLLPTHFNLGLPRDGIRAAGTSGWRQNWARHRYLPHPVPRYAEQ